MSYLFLLSWGALQGPLPDRARSGEDVLQASRLLLKLTVHAGEGEGHQGLSRSEAGVCFVSR